MTKKLKYTINKNNKIKTPNNIILSEKRKTKFLLIKGMRFAIREGGRTVGAGIVLNIIK